MYRRISRASFVDEIQENGAHENLLIICAWTRTHSTLIYFHFAFTVCHRELEATSDSQSNVTSLLLIYPESPFRVNDRIQPFVHRVRISTEGRDHIHTPLSRYSSTPRKAGPRVERHPVTISTIAPTLYIPQYSLISETAWCQRHFDENNLRHLLRFVSLLIHSRSDKSIVSYTRCELSDLG